MVYTIVICSLYCVLLYNVHQSLDTAVPGKDVFSSGQFSLVHGTFFSSGHFLRLGLKKIDSWGHLF